MRVAGIDCGTNSIRLLVADIEGDSLTDVVRRMEIVRLGEGVDRTGRLSDAALERTRKALTDYAAQIAGLGAERVRMVATSASRDAANADEFTAMVTGILGVAPEVITGEEEAALSFGGAVRGLPADVEAPFLVADIGGGSTELVRGSRSVDAARSVDVGCVRMTERHLHDDPPTMAEIEAATADIGAAIDTALATVDPDHGARTLVGLAGSVTTVTALVLGLEDYDSTRIHHARISYADVVRVTEELLAETRAERLAHGVMHPGRADVIGAGALILRVLMERCGAEEVIASEHDILDGIAWSVAG
ncbi:Ppx/GppA phosphatase family protein [Phytomonospora endophytica]|uniref:Exopolyphosphatase/guanosine-5'-triphosphate, 3'-diphosphate pyrophosphatase n=1 Tax=Phytomonospora endophytica TaxID=714109 RepID=A0A841FNS5_9ACTN|nr:Ppx/GppA phosphatase family protein [Phytomonospora endophytica]MBB6036523.1 exopolyphosphatase/guanosine-5'-triphosphate,3'-diphosphate pyrophosphatase [Phytomonospora endophytica]GIG65845.1 hydrolase [Phytomonospora endophytica]